MEPVRSNLLQGVLVAYTQSHTAAAERTWEQATPSSHQPPTSPPHVLARQQQLMLTPSRRVHAALELLRPAQLLLAFVVALLMVLQGVLQGLVGQLARQRLGELGVCCAP